MSSEMIERVARALYAAEQARCGGLMDPFETEGVHRAFMGDARAAIEAMREPTPEMESVCMDYLSDNGPTASCWSAMITAALGEGGK